ncbi:HK97 family phage prohead protease [Rhodovulum sp. P5]|uniref:HK97 family phage prohead protease n=1 Tax=Rhodovulum sp. P5 TaxID=1564506 RepID=UPI00352C604D
MRSEGGATRLQARFPYGVETELATRRREIIAPRAFASRIDAGEDIHLLFGHDFTKPLASRAAGSLELRDTDMVLMIEAEIDTGTSWAHDFMVAHRAGLITGLSPGFRVPPGGEKIERRGNELVRTVTQAELFELSAVTRPAYSSAQIEARAWQPVGEVAQRVAERHAALRWR